MTIQHAFGIIGGSGALGSAIAQALLLQQTVSPELLWISNRTGNAAGFADWPGVTITASNQQLAEACETILLSVPPASAPAIGVSAPDRLVISVMAGVTIERIGQLTGASRVVRAMSSPAAGLSLAYSPWCTRVGLDGNDRATVRALFEACGLTDEVPDEDQIDRFTALTGPVPGFVACYAECMVTYAVKHGIAPAVADRAIRQLFRASGIVLSDSTVTPAEHVKAMIDYAGTTAAGLNAMHESDLAASIEDGLDAAYRKALVIG